MYEQIASPLASGGEHLQSILGLPPRPDHSVHFYPDEQSLATLVTEFLAGALNVGQTVIIIATPSHTEVFIDRLAAKGIDVEEAKRHNAVITLDADATMAQFMVAGMPDERRFTATVGQLVERHVHSANGKGLRAYGEMVDVLWRGGQREAAIRLEELWHALASRHPFSLLCAYSMGPFLAGAGDPQPLEDVCRTHTYVESTPDGPQQQTEEERQLRAVIAERRTHALAAEIDHRRQLEAVLRSALAERSRTEATLRDTEQELRDFLENAVDGMHWVGPDGTILWANRAELELLGYAREEYIGRHIAEFHADRAVIEDILARLWRNEILRNCEARMRCKDGSIRHVVINSSVYWRDGEFLHTRCVTRDVTEQKRLQEERERATHHLTVEYAVTKLLADARRFDEVVPRLLHTVCEVGGWELGAMWMVDEPARVLRCVDVVHVTATAVEGFEAITRARTFGPGEGLPGRVWANGRATWIQDVLADSNFPRARDAASAGLHGAIAFPIRIGGRTVGVLEFFTTVVSEPDVELLRLFDSLGIVIGQFVERRNAQEVRERLAAIVDSSDDAIVSKTLDGIITSWNRGAEQMFGYTAEDAIGRHITLIIPSDRHSEEDDVLARLRRGDRIDHYETERQTKDGRRIDVALTVSPIRNAEGQILGASKVARDISERKIAEAALRRSEANAVAQAQVTAVLNRVGVAVTSSLDRESVVQTVTDLATEVTTAEFGAFFYNVIDPQSGEAFLLYTLSGTPKEAFAHFPKPRVTALFGHTFRGEGIIRVADVTSDPRYGKAAPHYGMPPGHLPVRSYLAVPVKGRSGDVLGGLFFGHSQPGVFTEQHEQMADGIASWASIALENARLHAESERAVHARDEFLSVAAHELRNPLNALQLQLVGLARAVDVQRDALSKEWVADRLHQATDDVGTLVRLVHNLLDVGRIAAGRLDLEPEDVDFAAIVGAVLNRFRQQFAKGQLVADLPSVPGHCDRLKYEQIVTNLVSNAIKYGYGKRIEVRLRPDGDQVTLSVTDHGIGIDSEQRVRIFERFARAVPRRRHGGFGLGLWIAHQTVKAMGGSLSVDSEVGRGSTFAVSIPRTCARNDGSPVQPPSEM
jgi:PAS domain S-box-containing protein